MKQIEICLYLYNMQNVLISLAVDVDFIKNMSGKFNLKPLNFVPISLFVWECTLKMIELELLTDVEIMFDYENAFRGGITRAICHYMKQIIIRCMIMMEKKESTYLQ